MFGERVGVNSFKGIKKHGLGGREALREMALSIIFIGSSEIIFCAFILYVGVLMYSWMCECLGGCVSGDGLGQET